MIPNKRGNLHVLIIVWRPSAITILFLLHSHSVFKQRRTKDTKLKPGSTQTPGLIWQQLIYLVYMRGERCSCEPDIDNASLLLCSHKISLQLGECFRKNSEVEHLLNFRRQRKLGTEAAISYQVSGVPEERQVLFLKREVFAGSEQSWLRAALHTEALFCLLKSKLQKDNLE